MVSAVQPRPPLTVESLGNARYRVSGHDKPHVVMVHAKDDAASAFYKRHGFVPSPNDPFRLFLLMKDIKASLGVGKP